MSASLVRGIQVPFRSILDEPALSEAPEIRGKEDFAGDSSLGQDVHRAGLGGIVAGMRFSSI